MGRERAAIALMVGALIAGAPVSVAAQSPELPPPEPTPHPFGQLRMGTLALTPVLKITNIGVDTNVFDLSGTERQSPDFTVTIEPGIETRVTTDRLDARAVTRVGLIYYRVYEGERSVNPGVDLTLDNRFSSRLSFYAKGNYGYGKDRVGFEIDSRPLNLAQNTMVGARLAGRKLEFDVHGRYDAVRFDPNARFMKVTLGQTLDRSTWSGGVGVSYHLSPYTSLTTSVQTSFDRFSYAVERDADAIGGTVGVRFSPRAMISGDAAFGYKRVDPRDPRTPAFSGITPAAGLSYTLGDFLSLGVGAQRDVQNSFYGDRPYFVYTLYEGSIRQALFHHLDIGGSLQYTTLEYRRFLVDGLAQPALPADILRMGTVSVGVPLARRLRVGCFVQRWERLSDERPYRTLRSGIEMTVGRANVGPRGVMLSGPAR